MVSGSGQEGYVRKVEGCVEDCVQAHLIQIRVEICFVILADQPSPLISIFYSYRNFSYCYKSLMIFQSWRSIINTWHTYPIFLLMFYGY